MPRVADLSDIAIDEASPVPAYYQVYEALRLRMRGQDLPAGTRLPTERALAQEITVSRATVRGALNRLERDGLVRRRQGDGTYVAEPRVEHDMRTLHGFTAELAKGGMQVRSTVLSLATVRPSAHLRDRLGVEDGPHTAIELRRVRILDDVPISLETVWLAADRCRPVLQGSVEGSLYDALRTIGITPTYGEEQLTATVLDEYEAHHLMQEPGDPAMLVDRLTYDAEGRCVECVKSLLRADRFTIRTNLDLDVTQPISQQAG